MPLGMSTGFQSPFTLYLALISSAHLPSVGPQPGKTRKVAAAARTGDPDVPRHSNPEENGRTGSRNHLKLTSILCEF